MEWLSNENVEKDPELYKFLVNECPEYFIYTGPIKIFDDVDIETMRLDTIIHGIDLKTFEVIEISIGVKINDNNE